MVKSLPTDGSIPGFALEFFSNVELFHCTYGLDVSVIKCFFVFIFCPVIFGRGSCIVVSTGQATIPWRSDQWAKGKLKKEKKKKKRRIAYVIAKFALNENTLLQ